MLGVKHNLLLDDHSYIRTVLSASHSGNSYQTDDLDMTDTQGSLLQTNDVLDAGNTFRLSSYYNSKINKRLTLRTGILLQNQNLDTYVKTREGIADYDGDGRPDLFTQRDFDGAFNQAEAFAQTQWRVAERLTLNAGLHGLYFDRRKMPPSNHA